MDSFTQEHELITKYHHEIAEFWRSGMFHSFDGVDDISIKYAVFFTPEHQKNLVIVQGRSESYLKYQEISYDFFQQGYNIFLLDHRGQGLSDRMLENPHKGYVSSFDDYAEDLHTFISVHVLPYCEHQQKPYLLAHSMGCAISSLYLAKYAKYIQAAVFLSPMFAIHTGAIPDKVADGLIYGASLLEKRFAKEAWYFPGQKDHYFKPFEQNRLSHSEVRYQLFRELYQQHEQLKLGGVTIQWLKLAHEIKNKIFSQLTNFKLPLLVLQAGADKIVDNQVQNEFCQRLNELYPELSPPEPITIEGAWHELLFEQDKYRNKALNHCLDWFEQN